jgi:hypothetical protein
VVGQAAEQIIAGVVLSERLAVTMYGAIHRAQFNGQRNLRGLVIDPKLLGESTFRLALTDAAAIATALALLAMLLAGLRGLASRDPLRLSAGVSASAVALSGLYDITWSFAPILLLGAVSAVALQGRDG